MVKKFLLILAFFFQAGFSNAQKGFWAGVNYLPQITGMHNKDDASFYDHAYQNKITYDQAAGIQLLYNFNNRMGLGTQVIFSSEGQKFLCIYNIPFPGKKRMDYLKIPLFISFNSNPDKKIIFKIMPGIQINYLLKADGAVVLINRPANFFDLEPAKNIYFHKALFAANLSAGCEYKISEKIHLGFMLRADFAFTDAEKKDIRLDQAGQPPTQFYKLENPSRPKTHNYSFSPMLMLSYKLK